MKTSLLKSQTSILIQGEKGGSSGQTTPVESPDDLRSIAKAKILLAIGEGEFEGQLTGQNVFLDGTPILDANGAENFPGVIWDFRPGALHQSYIPGLPSLENETAVGIELKSSQPYTRAITNSLLSAVRVRLRWPALQQQLDNGDVTGYRITYAIDLSTDGGEYETLLNGAVNGKTTQAYERSHRVDLPQGNNWQIRIRRLTANQNNNRVADTMQIAAITDVIDRKLKYPNTALLYVEFDASQFQNIPVISCEPYMRKIKVPSNYDPITRSYTGTWDGSFKIAWSDNPAWISYDIILDDRFGTGRRINASLVDKWELYNIAQYCDQLVPDGNGGTEPRYVCNIYIQQSTEAWQVLRDLASIYRGMTYWSNGQMYTVADMPRDVDYIYNNANVIDGRFSYSSSSEKVKYTRALISWDNPENAYESDVTSVSEQSLQRRYGDNVVELAALGCTRESEAQRRGKWAIFTNNNDRTVTFKVGLDGSIPMPGFVIGVGDKLIAGNRIGGRITAVNGNKITLDQLDNIAVNDRLVINLPSGKAQARTIKAINGREVTVTAAYSEIPKTQLLWSVESDELKLQQFRVLRVVKAESDNIEYEITAVEHNPGKFSYIDTGARLEERPISKIPIGAQEAPASVMLSQSIFTEQTISVTTLNIQWETAKNAVAYEVEWRKDDGEWITLPKVYSTSVDIRGVYTGRYLARVRAINSSNVKSIARESELKAITGKDSNEHLVSNLSTLSGPFEIVVNWTFPVGSEDTLFTELQMASDIAGSNTKKIADIAYPINSYSVKNLPRRTVQFFRASLVDKAGNHGEWSNWIRGEVSDIQSDYDALFGETFKVYTWFAWADDNAGTGFTTNETQGEGKNYLGVATEKKTSTPSGNWEDYTWTKIKTEIPPVFTPEEETQLDNLMAGKLPAGDKDMLAAQDALNNPALANNLLTSLALLNNGIDAASLNGETPSGAQSKASIAQGAAIAAAATDATTKANNAKAAAETYALAKANLAEVTAKAYADGKVTAEETRAIADAQAKADAAKTAAIAAAATDATTKANNAKAAAETYALAKANLAEVTAKAYADGKVTAEETRAIADAQAKADAAKTAAIAAAATDATTKANNAKAQAEANAALDALNKASAAKADAINVSLSSPLLKNESYYRTLPDPFFEKGMLAYSANYTGTSESLESLPIGTRFSVIKAGEHGGNVLRVQGDAWIYGVGLIPIDTNKRYKLKFKVKQHADGTGNRFVYAGVVTLDKNLNAISGGVGLHRYCAVSGASISEVEGWHTFEGYITGVGTSAHNQFRANTAYIRPVCIVNYNGGNGVADIDELSFYEVTEKGDLIEIGMETSTNAQAKADAAKNAAISTAANDATAKANAAKSQAEATAALDALNKASVAKNDAINTAAIDATTKANNARNAAMAQSGGPNLLSLSTFTQDGNKGGWNTGSVIQISSLAGVSALDGRTHALALNTRDCYEYQNIIPVTGGEVLYWGMWVNTQLTSQGVNFGYRKVINGSSENAWPAAVSLAPGQGWTWVQGSLVVQSDATAILPFLQISATSNFGTPLVQDLVISRSPVRAGALAAKDSLNAGDVGADPAGSATAVLQAVDALGLKSLGSYIEVMGNSCGHHTTGDWNGSVYSSISHQGGIVATVTIDRLSGSSRRMMFGLTATPSNNTSYGDINFAIYSDLGDYKVYEGGVHKGIVLSRAPAVGDVLSVKYDGIKVYYLVNGQVLKETAASRDLNLYFKASFYGGEYYIKNVSLSSLSNLVLASDDAQAKSIAAQTAAENYALTKANLAETTAKAYADGKVTAEETRAIADAQAKADAAKAQAISQANSALDARISTGQANGLSNILSAAGLPFRSDFVIYGDSNKFYPVVVSGGDQNVNRRIKIWRAYNEQAPNDWYSSTHKGQLNIDWFGNFGGWGGAGYFDQLLSHTGMYQALLADAYIFGSNIYYCFMLRGGGPSGAIYHFASDINSLPSVFYNQETLNAAANAYAPAPTTEINNERLNNLKLGNASFGNLIAYSSQFNSLKSRLGAFGGLTAETIAALAIATNHLQAGAVTVDKVSANAITAEKIAALAVATNHLQAGAVTADKVTADTALIQKLIANQGLFNQLQAQLGSFGGLSANSIAANAITVDKLDVLSKNLINNVSKTGVTDGWSGGYLVDHNHKGKTVKALEFPSSGNGTIFSNYFAVDHTKIYEVNFTIHRVSGGNTGTRYFGISADGDGYVSIVYPESKSVGPSANNFYFWNGDINDGEYLQIRTYIIGSEVDPKSIPETLNAQYCCLLNPSTKNVRLRGLNYYNSGVTTVDRWLNMSVTELGGGQISANQLLANTGLFNQLKSKIASFGGLTANEILADSALINKLVGTSALFDTLQSRLAVFGGLNANSIAADAIDGNHIRAGSKIESPIIEGGEYRLIGANTMKIESETPFGPDNLIEWRGPKLLLNGQPNWPNIRKSNATRWTDANGDEYFGGSLSAGILKTGVTNPDKNAYAVNTYPVEIGPFGSNGKSKTVVVSYLLSGFSYSSSNPGTLTAPKLSWSLERKIGAGSWETVSNGVFTGNSTSEWDGESRTWMVSSFCGGSQTFTDNSSSASDFEYRIRVTTHLRYHSTSNTENQNLSLVSIEQ